MFATTSQRGTSLEDIYTFVQKVILQSIHEYITISTKHIGIIIDIGIVQYLHARITICTTIHAHETIFTTYVCTYINCIVIYVHI